MHPTFVARAKSTRPIWFVTADTFAQVREQLWAAARRFAETAKFEPKAGQFLLLPGETDKEVLTFLAASLLDLCPTDVETLRTTDAVAHLPDVGFAGSLAPTAVVASIPFAPELEFGGPPECPQRPKCQKGLEEVYSFKAGSFSSLDAGGPQTKSALTTGTISVGLVFSSDGALAAG